VVVVAGGIDGGVMVPVVGVLPPVVVGGVVEGGVVTVPVLGMPPFNGVLVGVVLVEPVVLVVPVPVVVGEARVTFWPLDVRLPVRLVTVVVKPPLSWEAVVCCVDGDTTKLVIDVAVSVGSMEEVVMEGDVDVVASICRCSSGSCVSSTPPRAERRRDRPPSRRFRKSESRWETGPRRKLPHRRPPPKTIQIAPHACPSMTTLNNGRALPGTTRSSAEEPDSSLQIVAAVSNFFERKGANTGENHSGQASVGVGRKIETCWHPMPSSQHQPLAARTPPRRIDAERQLIIRDF
jgi:hypothetical protein